MPDVLIVLGQPESESFSSALGVAFQHAIEQHIEADRSSVCTQTLRVTELGHCPALGRANHLICPLTLEIPDWLIFPGRTVYRACREVAERQQQVQQWGYPVGAGDLWLPIIHTAKGTLYGEAIRKTASQYVQPMHLADHQRQPLYYLGLRLVRSLQAPPAVYLMQFGLRDQTAVFDRLFPFPAEPAIASCAAQSPDLFVCHWRCVSGKPVRDLIIPG